MPSHPRCSRSDGDLGELRYRGIAFRQPRGALRLVLSGGRYIPEQLLQTADNALRDQMPGFEGLTRRELDALRQLVKGLSNKEIGRELELSEVTIGLRLRSIYRKIGVKSRGQAIGLALRQGWDG